MKYTEYVVTNYFDPRGRPFFSQLWKAIDYYLDGPVLIIQEINLSKALLDILIARADGSLVDVLELATPEERERGFFGFAYGIRITFNPDEPEPEGLTDLKYTVCYQHLDLKSI